MQKRRKILFLISESWYFLSHRLRLARACVALGWEVVVATRIAEHAPINEPGIRVVPIGMHRSSRHPIHELRTLAEIYGILRDERPDILHTVGLKPVLYGATIAPLAGVPRTISALAGMGYIFMSASLRVALMRKALVGWLRLALRRRGSWLIVQNADDAKMLIGGGVVDSSQVQIIRGSGVELDHYRPTPQPETSPVVFAVVARMLRDKGIREVVLAARQLKRMGVAAEVWLVGAPDADNPTAICERQLSAWHAEGCVRWLGEQADIAAIWEKAHVCVLPSYREGLPKALLEAAACARPIITTDVTGCREVVEEGVNGLLVPMNDWCALAEAMAKLAADPALRARMGEAGRQLVERELGSDTINRQVLDLYEHALDARP